MMSHMRYEGKICTNGYAALFFEQTEKLWLNHSSALQKELLLNHVYDARNLILGMSHLGFTQLNSRAPEQKYIFLGFP